MDTLEDIAQQLRLLRLEVEGPGTGTGGTGTGPTGPPGGTTVVPGAGVIAQFSASGIVIPTTSSKIWIVAAPATITAVIMTMGTKPLVNRSCVVDVHVNGVSLWADSANFPTFTHTSTNPVIVAPDAPKAVVVGDQITAYVLDGGSGRDLEVFVVTSDVSTTSGGGGDVTVTSIYGSSLLYGPPFYGL